MNHFRPLAIGAAMALLGAAASQAADFQETRAQESRVRPLDLSTGSSIAIEAARATQARTTPEGRVTPPESLTTVPASGDTVQGVTVRPQAPATGRVVASTEARPLTSPDFTAADAEPPPLAVAIAPGVAVGAQGAAEDGITVRDPLEFDRLGTIGLTALF